MKSIPFLVLHRQYKEIKDQIGLAINRVLNSQYFILGNELSKFEDEFAKYLGVKHVVGVNSGTDALIMALKVLKIGKGDEVITPTQSFIATTLAITEVGATPIFIDSNPDTFLIDSDAIEAKITKHTKAILPVHLYGAPCNMKKIMDIAKKHKLYIIEDACQAHGAAINNQKVGTFGTIGTFSFYPGKNLGAYGDAGAICTNDDVLFEELIMYRNYGQKKKYYHTKIGINSRLDEIQAAILTVKLPYLHSWNIKRNNIAELYRQHLHKTIKTQKIIDNGISSYHLFVIEVDNRNKLKDFLEKNGVGTLIHYPVPIHLQECYANLGYKKGDFVTAEESAKKILSLPMYPELTENEVKYIAQLINQFYSF